MSVLALAIAVKGEWDADRVLHDLRAAGLPVSTEVHVACDGEHAPKEPPPNVFVHARVKASLFDLWGVAIRKCEAPWVAVLHADALPAPGWFTAIQRAIERDDSADGYWGPVEPGFGPSDKRMIGYLAEYVQFHRPLQSALKEVPGSNLVLPRGRFDREGDFSKTRLVLQGLAPRRVEDAIVIYDRPFDFDQYCGRRFRHGRAYAAARSPRLSLFAALPLTAVLPLVRTGRILRHAWRHRGMRVASLRWLPAIMFAEIFWSAGELAGYIGRIPSDSSAID